MRHFLQPFALEPNPDSEKAHLLISRGHRWKRLRSITAVSFSINSLKSVMPILHEVEVQHYRVFVILFRHATRSWTFCTIISTSQLMFTRNLFVFERHIVKMVQSLRKFQEFALDIICKVAFGETDTLQGKEDTYLVTLARRNFQPPESKFFTVLLTLSGA